MSFAFDPPPKKPKHHVWAEHHEGGWEEHAYHDDPNKAHQLAFEKVHQRYIGAPPNSVHPDKAYQRMLEDVQRKFLVWHGSDKTLVDKT